MAKDTIPPIGSEKHLRFAKQKMHIAGSGAKQGQWVACRASENCKLTNSPHVQELDLRYAQDWSGKRAMTDVTVADYDEYMKAKIAGTVEETRKPVETVAQKKTRLGKTVLTPNKEPLTPKKRLTVADLETEYQANQKKKKFVKPTTTERKPAPKSTPAQIVEASVTDMVLWPNQYNNFLQACNNNDVTIIKGKAASGGRMLGFGKKIVVVRNIRLEGTKENITKTVNFLNNMVKANPASGYSF